jgi:hypothetical protein
METRLERYSTYTNRILCNLLSQFFYLFIKFSSWFMIHIRSPFMALSNVDKYG